MAPRRKNTAAPSSPAAVEIAGPAATAATVAAAQEETTTAASASSEATATEPVPSSASERRSPEPEISEDEESSPMEIDDAVEETPSSEVSKEVDNLNELLANFRLGDEEEDDFVVGGDNDPTKDDLRDLHNRYEVRHKRRAKMLGMIHARFGATIRQIKQIRLDRALLEDAIRKVTAMKEEMLTSLTQQCASLRKDMDSLKISILQGFDEEEDTKSERAPQADESRSAKFSVKWDKNNPEHCALHRCDEAALDPPKTAGK
ncbi:hypothetical protein BGZ67_010685, partial [Mortierella alpina]